MRLHQGQETQLLDKEKDMRRADRVWIALGIAVPVFLRMRTQSHKIKDLKKVIQILELENEFLRGIRQGDGVNKELADKFFTIVRKF